MMGDFGFGHMGFGWLFWIALIVAGFFLIRGNLSGNSWNQNSGQSALDILKQRYARGEISKEEFNRMKKDLI
ncbi:MAG TPA: SHOCT domain-containing protein [Calditrichaeota bacterium]|nr:SHOCT domain-containing protein [Calditrichota bacterium]